MCAAASRTTSGARIARARWARSSRSSSWCASRVNSAATSPTARKPTRSSRLAPSTTASKRRWRRTVLRRTAQASAPSSRPRSRPMAREATVLIVPGLRGHVPQHWQTLLASRLPRVRVVEPMGREDLDCGPRVAAIEREANAIKGPLLLVAHSGGIIMVVHWAKKTQRAVHGALLATPPDFERAMPAEYPTTADLRAGGWLPVPRDRLLFSTIVAASRNDPLGCFERVAELARDW